MLYEPWQIHLFGGLSATRGTECITRFRTRKVGALLAWLAFHRRRALSREEAAGVIWPESDEAAGRASLRAALSSLRAQLEPHGVPSNSVVIADRAHVSLHPSSTITDVFRFEAALHESTRAKDVAEQLNADMQAVECYSGELLSGWYEEWIFIERERLQSAYEAALNRIVSALMVAGREADAAPYFRKLIELDSANEGAQLGLMQAELAAGRPHAVLRRYCELHTALAELGAKPGADAQVLAVRARSMAPARTQLPSRQRSVSALRTKVRPAAPFDQRSAGPTLPLTLDRFFGRSEEVKHICRLLEPSSPDNVRLVTITGAGGAGKTRLAIQTAVALATAFDNRVAFVSLAEVNDVSRIIGAIAQALRINISGAANTMDQLVNYISELPYLFVLDNVEQMLSGANAVEMAAEVSTLLARAPRLRILITSRQRVDVVGEREVVVAALPLPVDGAELEQIAEVASVQLFVDRATAVRADFCLRGSNCTAVSELCRRLEGIPLAIELAAAWSHVLSPQQMLTRLTRRFDLLVTRRKGVPARHSTMRDAIEWSTRLLTKAQQVFLCRLAVFSAGFSLEAVQEVLGEADALNMVTELVERSLVIAEEAAALDGPEIRYRLLETLRTFGWEHLDLQEKLELRRRHASWYASWSVRASEYYQHGNDQLKGLQIVDLEIDNVRAAVLHATQDSASCMDGIRLMGRLHYYWQVRGNYAETRAILDDLLASPEAVRAGSHCCAGYALAGTFAVYQNDLKAAQQYYGLWLTSAREMGDSKEIASALQSLGSIAAQMGEFDEARKYYEQCMDAYEAAGSRLGVAAATGAFGELALQTGDYDDALVWCKEAVRLQRIAGHRGGITHHLKLLAEVHARRNEDDAMRACLEESLAGYFELADWRGMAELLVFLAEHTQMSDDVALLVGHAAALHKRTSAAPINIEALNGSGVSTIGPVRYKDALALGAAMDTPAAYHLAHKVLRSNANLPAVR